jgi:hypothetical protein
MPAPPEPEDHAPDSGELLDRIESSVPAAEQVEPPAEPSLFAAEETAARIVEILADMAQEPDCTFQPASQLFQDFTVRCRMAAGPVGIDLAQFRRRFAMAVAGIPDDREPRWQPALNLRVMLPMMCSRHSSCWRWRQSKGCHARMTSAWPKSMAPAPGRIRRLLDHLEKSGLIVVRTDYGGRRSIGIPGLGMTTAPMEG